MASESIEKIIEEFDFFDGIGETIDADIDEARSLFVGEDKSPDGGPITHDYQACIDRLYTAFMRASELETKLRRLLIQVRRETGNVNYHAQFLE